MNTGNKFLKNLIIHIKYPYTALIIAVMWIGIAIIISVQQRSDFDILVIVTSICTLIIAIAGFKVPK